MKNLPLLFWNVLSVLVWGILILFPASGAKSVLVWLGVCCVVPRVLSARGKREAVGIGWCIGLYLAACSLSAFFSVDVAFSLRQLVKLIENVAAFGVLYHLLLRPGGLSRGLVSFGMAFGAIACLDVAFMLVQMARGTIIITDGRWFDSLLGYPTIAAGMYGVGFLVIVSHFFQSKVVWQRSGWFVCLLAISVLLYRLQTRSALAGILIGLGVFMMRAPLRRSIRLGIIAAAVAVMLAMLAVPNVFRERILSRSLSDRREIWQDVQTILQTGYGEQPWRRLVGFGYGHRIFERSHVSLPAAQRRAMRVYDHTHNVFIEAHFQTGLLGLLAFVALLAAIIIKAARNGMVGLAHQRQISAAGVLAAFVHLLVYAQFSLFFSYLPILLFWLLAACLLVSASPDALREG